MSAKYRADWIQTDTRLDFTIYVRGLKDEDVGVSLDSKVLKVLLKNNASGIPEELFWEFQEDCEIVKTTVNQYKINVVLNKKKPMNWNKVVISSYGEPTQPEYPQCTKPKKDWDKIEAECEERLREEKERSSSKDPMEMFRKLYSNTTDEGRRAMNKSYTESRGTVLSMDWNKVCNGHVDCYNDSDGGKK